MVAIIFGVSVPASNEDLVEAAVGTNVTFSCLIDQDSGTVIWHHYPIGAKLAKIVYLNGKVFEAYRDRIIVINSRIGEFNLIILGVSLGDSAKYTCTSGQRIRSFELTVLELYPSPNSCASNSSHVSIIGRNSCGIEPEVVSLNCTLRYQGNFQPFLEWKSSNDDSFLSTQRSIDNRTTVSTVILKADEQKSASYSCFVKYHNSSLTSSFSCTLNVNIISLINETSEYYPECRKTAVKCLTKEVNGCAYTWTDEKSVKIGSNSTLDLLDLQVGQYVCTADCLIRDTHRCILVPAKANVTCSTGRPKQTGTSRGTIAGIAIGATVIIVLAASLIVFLGIKNHWWKNKCATQETPTGDETAHHVDDTRLATSLTKDELDAEERKVLNLEARKGFNSEERKVLNLEERKGLNSERIERTE